MSGKVSERAEVQLPLGKQVRKHPPPIREGVGGDGVWGGGVTSPGPRLQSAGQTRQVRNGTRGRTSQTLDAALYAEKGGAVGIHPRLLFICLFPSCWGYF